MSGWPVAGPSGFWLLASRPASKSSSPVSNDKHSTNTDTVQTQIQYIHRCSTNTDTVQTQIHSADNRHNRQVQTKMYMYIITNTTIFFVVYLLLLRYSYMFRLSMLAIFRLYMRNLSINYTNVCGEVYSLWGGVGARSFFLCWRKGCGLELFRGLC